MCIFKANQSDIKKGNNGDIKNHSKHFEVLYQFFKETVEQGLVSIKYCMRQQKVWPYKVLYILN